MSLLGQSQLTENGPKRPACLGTGAAIKTVVFLPHARRGLRQSIERVAWVDTARSDGGHMKSYVFKPKHKQSGLRVAHIVFAGLAALLAASDRTDAARVRHEQSAATRPAGEPIMAIVSLRDQQITVYDDKGWILRAPVSTGQKGRETPAGIFSIIQKKAEHYSNLYDDAYMPHMQRITWSGIALHGGPLPGYPASHGCIRMPYDFAERLFGVTKLGMRLIVAPGSAAPPVAIEHPALFRPKTGQVAAAAAAAAAKAEEATRKADQARIAAVTANRQSVAAMTAVRKAENLKLRAETELTSVERAIASAASPEAKEQAEGIKAKVTARISELEAQLVAGKSELQPKLDAVMAAREAAAAAESARVVAAEAARKAARDLEPVAVFISRKTQRLYVRQAFQPILDIPITVNDADRPIGTHIFTATERVGTDIRWSLVSLVGGRADGSADEPNESVRKGRERTVVATAADPESAKAALGRITIPQDSLDLIAEKMSPRSSLIISDEALSSETGNGTEFVVALSGEPQGGLKNRRPSSPMEARYDRPSTRYWRAPFAQQYFNRWPRF
jgi:lipoprotein-anchoring transpeptidase ErfK/SrfK